jgi:hypothetical protein
MQPLRGLLLKPTLNLLEWIVRRKDGNSLIIGSPMGWSWQSTLDTTHHGALAGPANAHRHSDLANIGIDDHHARDHATRHHSGGADALALGSIAGNLTDAQHGSRTVANAHAHSHLSGIGANDHHNRQHAITSTSDHTSAATSGRMLKADANGLPVNATNTDTDVTDAVTKKHDRQHALDSASDHTGTITDAQHGVRAVANAHAHSHLSGIGANDHHARSHDHSLAADGTPIAEAGVPAHMSKNKLAWTANKLLKGAGAGSDPVEIDVPSGATSGSYTGSGTTNRAIPHGLFLCVGKGESHVMAL